MRLHRLLPLALAIAAYGCGGSDNSATDPNANGATGVTNGNFTATINGTNWSAIGKVAVTRGGSVISIAAGSLSYVLGLGIGAASLPGVYPLSYQNPTGSIAIVTNVSGASWSTATSGGTGTVTITALTATHVAGTFVFDAPAASGTGNGTLHVTNGKFDVTF
jgi:hypothetical protein